MVYLLSLYYSNKDLINCTVRFNKRFEMFILRSNLYSPYTDQMHLKIDSITWNWQESETGN